MRLLVILPLMATVGSHLRGTGRYASGKFDLALDVPGGTFHLVENGAWN